MDGNGRWAQKRGQSRLLGHRKGAETARDIVEHAKDIGIKYLTLYAFSIENWNRPQDEVKGLMDLLRRYLKSELSELHKKGARVKVIGDRSKLDDDILSAIDHLEDVTKDNKEIVIQIALSYGSRQEIVSAVQTIAANAVKGLITPDDITPEYISKNLMTSDVPDPDLLIRTSGEKRISNYLLWQCAYTEFYFTDTLWPDFTKQEFEKAVDEYQNRDRRFGSLNTSDQNNGEKIQRG